MILAADTSARTMQRSFLSLAKATLKMPEFCWRSTQYSLCQHSPMTSFAETGRGEVPRVHRDRLLLRGLVFHGKHGVYEEEKKLGQKFKVDMDAWLDLRKAGETDELEDSVSYSDIYSLIKAIVEGPAYTLIESVATAIAMDVLGKYPRISEVRVRVGKPHVAVEGLVDFLGVEIFRSSLQLTRHSDNNENKM